MQPSLPNIAFHYCYRAGNYKLYETVIFTNPDGLSLATIDRVIRERLIDQEFFDPVKWGLNKPAFPAFDDALDHDWCEYLRVEGTDEDGTTSTTMTVFLRQLGSPPVESLPIQG